MLDSYANPRLRLGFASLSRILPTPLVFIPGYANTENVFYCLIISRLLKLGKLDRVQFWGSQVLNRVCNFPILGFLSGPDRLKNRSVILARHIIQKFGNKSFKILFDNVSLDKTLSSVYETKGTRVMNWKKGLLWIEQGNEMKLFCLTQGQGFHAGLGGIPPSLLKWAPGR